MINSYVEPILREDDIDFVRKYDLRDILLLSKQAAIGKVSSILEIEAAKFNTVLELIKCVQTLFSSGRYDLFLESSHLYPKLRRIEHSLISGSGICGDHQEIFCRLADLDGIPTRKIAIYFKDDNGIHQGHALVEAFLHNKWMLFDITYGAFWSKSISSVYNVLSLQEVLDLNLHQRSEFCRFNPLDTWLLGQYEAGIDPFYYTRSDRIYGITYDEVGCVTVYLNECKPFEAFPVFIGCNSGFGQGISFKLVDETRDSFASICVEISISAINGCQEGLPLIIDGIRSSIDLKIGVNIIEIRNGATISLTNESGYQYAVIDRISLSVLDY